MYEIDNKTIDKKDDEEDIELCWPLFVASEKGNMQLFNMLIKYADNELINKKTKRCGLFMDCIM